MRLVAACLAVLLWTTSASAATTVLAYGDSITADLQSPSWARILRRIRSDLTVTQAGLGGDMSDSYSRFSGYFVGGATYNYVVILIGTNDYAFGFTTLQTIMNIQAMVNLAVGNGSQVIVLTLLPVLNRIFIVNAPARQPASAAISALILTHFAHQPNVTVSDIRTAITDAWPRYTRDGLHPIYPGAVFIAQYVSTLIPAS